MTQFEWNARGARNFHTRRLWYTQKRRRKPAPENGVEK